MAYYESFGFIRVAHVALGNDNPKWKKDPIIIPLVSGVHLTRFKPADLFEDGA